MSVHKVCQNFFRDALAPFHQYRQNALMDATVALINGASLTLTSIERFLPGSAQVKNKSKRLDRLMGNEAIHRDIPMIFRNITSMLTLKWHTEFSYLNKVICSPQNNTGASMKIKKPTTRRHCHSSASIR